MSSTRTRWITAAAVALFAGGVAVMPGAAEAVSGPSYSPPSSCPAHYTHPQYGGPGYRWERVGGIHTRSDGTRYAWYDEWYGGYHQTSTYQGRKKVGCASVKS